MRTLAATISTAALFLSACAGDPEAINASPPSVIDGRVLPGAGGEWASLAGPGAAAAAIDARFLTVVFAPPGEPDTLQASARTVEILLDTDSDAATGNARSQALPGAEVSLRFAPPRDDGSPGSGVSVRVFSGGSWREVGHAGVGLIFAPTYASEATELRLDRALLAERTGHAIAAVRGTVHSEDAGTRWSAPFEVRGPSAIGPAPGVDAFPAPAGDLRVVSWNILKSSPRKNPKPFARVLSALQPDAVLVQEWDGADGAELAAWFTRELGGTWSAFAWPDQGVGVVSRFPITETMRAPIEWAPGRTMRFAWAVTRTPAGEVLLGSTHLKCCGSAGSEEDRRRLAESAAIASELARVEADRPARSPLAGVVVGGDLNLVGSRPPVDRIALAADIDGSDLAIAATPVLGDGAAYTWREDDSRFSPGRLDFLLFSDASFDAAASFAVDLRLLSPGARAAHGLGPGDATASDHLPLVLDLSTR